MKAVHFMERPRKVLPRAMRVAASIVCIETVIPAAVQSQHAYTWRDVRFGERFVEIYTETGPQLVVDYGRLHETERFSAARLLMITSKKRKCFPEAARSR